jgi:predicted nuclease of predicted toxin-antitoxin system
VARFLLDANLSPKIGRFLTEQFQLDVVSLQGQRLGQLPDHEVIRMAHSEKRVVITLDRDFASRFERAERPHIGVIYLDLPNALRTIPEINRILAQLFNDHGERIAFDSCLVVVTEHEVRTVTN